MSLGIIILCHNNVTHTAKVAQHWLKYGCPVVIHIDQKTPIASCEYLHKSLSHNHNIRFAKRHSCRWGGWSLVKATQEAALVMLKEFPEVEHIYLSSDSCLPLRPVSHLKAYLALHPKTDFIESIPAKTANWIQSGLEEERFTLYFPFDWKKQRKLFDGFVTIQRKLGIKRAPPRGVTPHIGSQWWCLTRRTLLAILHHHERQKYDRYFQTTWIPDESYFQSLARLVSSNIESKSLTFSQFNPMGKPYVFYDDHLTLLQQSNCFVARKIWPGAQNLYSTFLSNSVEPKSDDPQPPAKATPKRISTFLNNSAHAATTPESGSAFQHYFYPKGPLGSADYFVFWGFEYLFDGFEKWLQQTNTTIDTHARLFAPEQVYYAQDAMFFKGALSTSAHIRDYDPKGFLRNLIWNGRPQRQAFILSPDDRQAIVPFIAQDTHAHIFMIRKAWSLTLAPTAYNFTMALSRLSTIEERFITQLHRPHVKATLKIWELNSFMYSPQQALEEVLQTINPTEKTARNSCDNNSRPSLEASANIKHLIKKSLYNLPKKHQP